MDVAETRFAKGICSAGAFALLAACAGSSDLVKPADHHWSAGQWRAVLTTPGGALPFGLEIGATDDVQIGPRAWIHNGVERVAVGSVLFGAGRRFELALPPYRSRLVGSFNSREGSLEGEWQRDKGAGWVVETSFRALRGEAPRFSATDESSDPAHAMAFDGRWRVPFSSTPAEHAVGEFQVDPASGRVAGTFLTTVGDYRYLAGRVTEPGTMWLSCFDGAHAFLFRAVLQDDRRLRGEFWSRGTWHESWTATHEPEVELPDAFSLTKWTGSELLCDMVFPDLHGDPRSLDDPEFVGKGRLLVVFGTWCPNCADLTRLLVKLDGRYRADGLKILGLAFELGRDAEARAATVRDYLAHHGASWPVLIAGPAGKAEASAAFPLLDRIRSYPTTVFLNERNEVQAVYTGFCGPATGAKHAELVDRFEARIQDMLRSSAAHRVRGGT